MSDTLRESIIHGLRSKGWSRIDAENEADDRIAAMQADTDLERIKRERDQAVEALTKATADIAAALIMAGKEGKIAKWTAPYVETINRIDASIEGTGHE